MRTAVTLGSSDLIETELLPVSRSEKIQSDVTRVLDGVALAALDALHLEAAMRIDAAAILTYNHRLGEATRSAGLDVIVLGVTSAP